MCRARSAAVQHDRIIQHAAVDILELLKSAQEVGDLFAQEQIVFGERELPFFVFGV